MVLVKADFPEVLGWFWGLLVSLGSRVGGSGAGEGWCIWRPGVEVVELGRAGDLVVPGVP